jgi:hypothetical protein
MIPPSYLYSWINREPAPMRLRLRRGVPGLVASIVAGGISGAVTAATVLMAALA